MTRTETAALLRNMTVAMTIRYGTSCQSYANASHGDTPNGKTAEQWNRACSRQLAAVQRLTLSTLRLARATS